MFDPNISNTARVSSTGANWEKNVKKVKLEPCDADYDPLCMRVVFYKDSDREQEEKRVNRYVVGASYLRERLNGIRRAGYKAPMTEKAISMVEECLAAKSNIDIQDNGQGKEFAAVVGE